jgi:hypothetical protein
MHKIQKNIQLKYKKVAIVTLVILILITGLALGYSWLNRNTKDELSSGDTKQNEVTSGHNKATEQPDTLPTNSQSLTTEDVPVDQSAAATITRLEQKDMTVYFDTTVTNATELGRCVVIFSTPNDRPITKEFDAVKNNDTYICSLSMSALEFSYLGTWDAMLRYYNGSSQVITKGTIKIS